MIKILCVIWVCLLCYRVSAAEVEKGVVDDNKKEGLVLEEKYDASKIKRQSHTSKANKKLLEGRLTSKDIADEATKKYGEYGLKSPREIQKEKDDKKKRDLEVQRLYLNEKYKKQKPQK